MRIIKRVDLFMLQRFLPVLALTFVICLFIVMMQFLYRFIEDLVGKGLSFNVIAELFGYASLTMIPTALPLAVLLAALMTFGNLGEKFELTAMKSAGISLFRIMAPLIILMTAIAIGAFFFQNDVLPVAQTKMYTLLLSMRQKSPEVEIPEKSFYEDIPGMNLYVDRKNPHTGMLYGMVIYDVSRGMDNSRIIMADSGSISFTKDKSHLFLNLHKGELFENVQDNSLGFNTTNYLPFRRESFNEKKVYIAFDANFNRIDEGTMRSQYIGKNISQLIHSIDSIQTRIDSIGDVFGRELKTAPYVGVTYYKQKYVNGQIVSVPFEDVHPTKTINVDSVFASPTPNMAKSYLTQALMTVLTKQNELEYKTIVLDEENKVLRQHDIEMQKKFTLSFACLIFFFIGAPLGAIIKRGGIGYPLVISVLLFTFYFIIDNIGHKMAKDGKVDVWEGMWLSSMILLPLGIYITWAAVKDKEFSITDIFRRIVPKRKRPPIPYRKFILDPMPAREQLEAITEFDNKLHEYETWRKGRPVFMRLVRPFKHPRQDLFNATVYKLTLSTDAMLNSLINRYPAVIRPTNLNTIYTLNARIIEHLSDSVPVMDDMPDEDACTYKDEENNGQED